MDPGSARARGALVQNDGGVFGYIHRATESFSVIALRRIRESDSTEYGF
jgi:hypothetical protein